MTMEKTNAIWAAIEKCFPIDDTIWMPDEISCTLYDEIAMILGEEDA